jgi:hypothetical protein
MMDNCANRDTSGPDRGAFDELKFNRCARGFVLRATDDYGRRHTTFAFDRVEDVAKWLVEQYGPLPKGLAAKAVRVPKRATRRRR